MAEKKTCSICKETKPLSDFHKDKNGILGRKSACKECAYARWFERQKEYLKEHPNTKSKICPYCKEEKDINEFGKGKYSLDGRQTYCMKCTIIKSTIYQKKHPEKSRTGNAKWCAKNYDYNIARRVKWSQDNPEKSNFNTRKALKRKAYYKTHAHKLTIDEKPIQDSKGYLLTKCTYCGQYFYPTVRDVRSRIACLDENGGEGRLYCSDNCKAACPTYNQHLFPKGFKPASSREAQPVLRQAKG